jgi:hypothetical protein
MNNKTDIAYDSLRNLLSELSNEEDLINNRTLYIEKVRTCEKLFKDAISDTDKYTTEDVKTELDRTRRNLLMMNAYCLGRITDNIVPERRETLKPQLIHWLTSLITRYEKLDK